MEVLALISAVLFWVTVVAFVQHLTLYNKCKAAKELWKTYALALEVIDECESELRLEIPGEGCMKRCRRREPYLDQRDNAVRMAGETLSKLEQSGEYA